ncbi:MAG TPA: hypothetical protein PK675_04895 [Clostridia bacterium]|nr:hypothetical protein [Clostridia bacterium]
MSIEYLKINVYNLLDKTLNSQFDRKQKRPYFCITGLTYKGQSISVMVPYQANINKFFQKEPEYIVQTPLTLHTKPGNIAGWHIIKIIPSYRTLVYTSRASGDVIEAEKIAKQQYSKMQTSAQKLLNFYECGKYPFGSNEFDKALQEMDKIFQKQQSPRSVPHQPSHISMPTIFDVVVLDSSQTQQEKGVVMQVDEKTQAIAVCLAETLTNPKKKKLLIKNGKLRLAPLSKALSLKSYELDKSIIYDFDKLKRPINEGETQELSKILTKYIKRNDRILRIAKPFALNKEKDREQELNE